ncbi:hypothetical protein C8034_v011392 [Colletotrichum sidae]|uniref:F-box domain-containing protein n=1 Tax=Colletotrichum sidae TaxID=1347389 RepID=A0A4R8TIM4_9PEZI|nr:hypothetical protein C8034_v011392 [Colletotrichum sidae]
MEDVVDLRAVPEGNKQWAPRVSQSVSSGGPDNHHRPTTSPLPTTPRMAASRPGSANQASPPLLEVTTLLQQIPDIIFEIASHLPEETALGLALTCKPLYALLFHRTLKRLTQRGKHLFLFTLMRDLGGKDNSCYYCHTCVKIWTWRCPLARSHGPCDDSCPLITPPTLHRELNAKTHACVATGYFTGTIPEMGEKRGSGSKALHTNRTGWCRCCEYSRGRPTPDGAAEEA